MEKDLMYDIIFASAYIKYGYHFYLEPFEKRSELYPFTTENLAGYYDCLDFKDKRILTVAASGDHMFNAILNGAKGITLFDINRLTKYYVDLKKAMINALDFDDFKRFFATSDHNKHSFDIKLYKAARDLLTEDSKIFWDELYKNWSGMRIRNNLFRIPSEYIINNKHTYLNESNFNILKKKINNFNFDFIECNITQLQSKIDTQKFDLMLFSNISDYIYRIFKSGIFIRRPMKDYKSLILNLGDNLNENGQIALAYIYEITACKPVKRTDYFNNNRKRNAVFNEDQFRTIYFDSVINKNQQDAVMIYTKK